MIDKLWKCNSCKKQFDQFLSILLKVCPYCRSSDIYGITDDLSMVIGGDIVYEKRDEAMTGWFRKLVNDLKEFLIDGEYHTMNEMQETFKEFNVGRIKKVLKWLNSNWRYQITEAYKMEVILDNDE